MLTGRKIDDRFLDRWERNLCSELERSTGRPFSLIRDDRPPQGVSRQVWLIDPVLASVCSHAPCACGYIVRYEQDRAGVRLWIGVGVADEPVLGGFLRDSLAQPGFLSSVRPLFKRLDAAAFMGQGSWVQSTLTIADGSAVGLTGSLLEGAAAIYSPATAGSRLLVIEVHRVYETADDMELDTDRLAGRLVKDFGPLYNGLFPRTIRRWSA